MRLWRPLTWVHFQPMEGGLVQKVTNLISLYQLGHQVGQFSLALANPHVTPMDITSHTAFTRMILNHMLAEDPLPFESTRKGMVRLVNAIERMYDECKATPSKFHQPLITTVWLQELNSAISEVTIQLQHELDAMPIFFVTPRRAYSIDALINDATKIFGQDEVRCFSPTTVFDIQEAGKCIAFDRPTAAGFHCVRAVEAVARGYHVVVVGTSVAEGIPLGPVINGLRTKRDKLKLPKDDTMNIAIDLLDRFTKTYRNPITHPQMVLDLPKCMVVFDAMKCVISVMVENAKSRGPVADGCL